MTFFKEKKDNLSPKDWPEEFEDNVGQILNIYDNDKDKYGKVVARDQAKINFYKLYTMELISRIGKK